MFCYERTYGDVLLPENLLKHVEFSCWLCASYRIRVLRFLYVRIRMGGGLFLSHRMCASFTIPHANA